MNAFPDTSATLLANLAYHETGVGQAAWFCFFAPYILVVDFLDGRPFRQLLKWTPAPFVDVAAVARLKATVRWCIISVMASALIPVSERYE